MRYSDEEKHVNLVLSKTEIETLLELLELDRNDEANLLGVMTQQQLAALDSAYSRLQNYEDQ